MGAGGCWHLHGTQTLSMSVLPRVLIALKPRKKVSASRHRVTRALPLTLGNCWNQCHTRAPGQPPSSQSKGEKGSHAVYLGFHHFISLSSFLRRGDFRSASFIRQGRHTRSLLRPRCTTGLGRKAGMVQVGLRAPRCWASLLSAAGGGRLLGPALTTPGGGRKAG